MVAPNTRIVVVEFPTRLSRGRDSRPLRARDLLPWADPYIAGLVQRLKSEIEAERAAEQEATRPSGGSACLRRFDPEFESLLWQPENPELPDGDAQRG